jgi:hypothetical protein
MNNIRMKLFIKIMIAILLMVCLYKMPYNYYTFVRFASFLSFGYLAYEEFKSRRSIIGLLLIGAAILLNPFSKIHFKRNIWNEIDMAIAIVLFTWVIIDIVFLYIGKRKEKIKV